jgi:serine/threonine protein kinase
MRDGGWRIGETIAHYRVIEKLAGVERGGGVYKVDDTLLHRFAALKCVPENVANDPQRLARFRHEAQVVSALNHPNICTMYAIGEVNGRPFVAMDYLEGLALNEFMRGTPLELERLLEISIGIAEALTAAHAKGIIHRDVKPANIFITKLGCAKLLNFGLDKMAAPIDGPQDLIELMITHVGAVNETLPYMSPEQVQGQPLDHRSTIFSLGAVIYEMSTSQRPFVGKTAAAVIASLFRDTPKPLTQLRIGVPVMLQRILDRCLAKDLHERYGSFCDLRDDLKRLHLEIAGPNSGSLSQINRGGVVG